MRRKLLFKNTTAAFLYQIVAMVCAFILPRLILEYYGSETNGLVTSIVNFLSIITFMEFGVGAVVKSALYKPLAEKDTEEVSRILASGNKFFVRIALILSVYICGLIVLYPRFVDGDYSFLYTALLIIAISVSTFAQYFFGVIDRLLLTADQRSYIQDNAQTISIIVNTIVCAILIKAGATIQTVKFVTSAIYIVRIILLRLYVNNRYRIDRRIKYQIEPLKQKWNGIAQHIAAVVLDQTDIVVLTTMSTLTNVSIYSVYHLVLYGVQILLLSLTNGFQSLIGDMLAKDERNELVSFFSWTEWVLHTGTVFVFGCSVVLIIPFVKVYTSGINDANYIIPAFAILLTLAHAAQCLKLPYHILILAAGRYKETQNIFIITAAINIVISVATVHFWGLIGVATGTLCAMFYQTLMMVRYDKKAFPDVVTYRAFIKHLSVDLISAILGVVATIRIPLMQVTYYSWIKLAIIDSIIWIVLIGLVNFIFYKTEMISIIKMLKLHRGKNI